MYMYMYMPNSMYMYTIATCTCTYSIDACTNWLILTGVLYSPLHNQFHYVSHECNVLGYCSLMRAGNEG